MRLGVFLLVIVASAAWARAEVGELEFALSMGYANLQLHGSADPFDHRDGFRLEPRVSIALNRDHPQLRLGFGLGMSGFSKREDNDSTVIIDDDDVIIINADDVQAISLIEPEFQISWRQTFGGDRRWFIEPGVGAGAIIGNYWIGSEWGYYYDEDHSEWDITAGVRPFLRGGFQFDHFTLGIEAAYLMGGTLDFTQDIDGTVREFYAGVFFGGRF